VRDLAAGGSLGPEPAQASATHATPGGAARVAHRATDPLDPEGRRAGVGEGTLALDVVPRVDFERLREERRRRVLHAANAAGLDALVLGREPNARYATGARRLQLAGVRQVGPGCVLLVDTGEAYVMSTWADGVPPEIPLAHLYGLTWNPSVLVASLRAIPGLERARRVGVDGLGPGFERLLAAVAPNAELVDAVGLMHEVRRQKTPEELEALRIAVAVAEGCLTAALDTVHGHKTPGASWRHGGGRADDAASGKPPTEGATAEQARALLEAAALERLGDYGLTTTSFWPRIEPALATTREHGPFVCSFAVLYEGYEGVAVATLGVDALASEARLGSLARRVRDALDAMCEQCRPGTEPAALAATHERHAGPVPVEPIVRGLGLGAEPPVLGARTAPSAAGIRLAEGMVLALTAEARDGTARWRDGRVVAVEAAGTELLSRLAPALR
jgi:Xaa-Pro dipeptidase